MQLTPEMADAILTALKEGDSAAALELLEGMLVEAVGEGEGEAPADTEGEALAETGDDEPAEDMQPATEARSEDAKESSEEMQALSATLVELTGASEPGEQLAAIRKWKASEETEAQRRATLDASSRRALVGELIKLGAETPATAWADEDRSTPVQRLASEPVEDMRARVTALKATGKRGTPRPPVATATTSVSGEPRGDVTKLSRADLDECKRRGWSPQDFADRMASAVRTL